MRASVLGVGLLFSSCFVFTEPKQNIYVVSSLEIPVDGDDPSAGSDFDFDGNIDNELPEWQSLFGLVNVNPQQQLTNRINNGDFLFGLDIRQTSRFERSFSVFSASALTDTPLFDGSDSIFAIDEESFFSEIEIERGSPDHVVAKGAAVDWILFPFETGEVLSMPLQRAEIDASFDDFGSSGKLTGLLNAIDAALLLERVPAVFDALLQDDAAVFGGGAPVSCEGDSDGLSAQCQPQGGFCSDRVQDGALTGLCVDSSAASATIYRFLDANRDGVFVVDFDEATNQFIQNDLEILFTLSGQNPPGGFMGSLFNIDSNDDGIDESMPIGVRFTAAPATRID